MQEDPDRTLAAVVLAAGAGSRFGAPKALARDADGTSWLLRTVETVSAAGCAFVIVVLGARGSEAERVLRWAAPPDPSAGSATIVVQARDWQSGLSASLRAGLIAAAGLPQAPVAAVIVPVDVPDLDRATVGRLIGRIRTDGGPAVGVDVHTLRQARFSGRPGHPVVIGRAHWPALLESLSGDTGARPYLIEHGVVEIECSDLSSGIDVDAPAPATPRAH